MQDKLDCLKKNPPKRIIFGSKKMYSEKDSEDINIEIWKQEFFNKRHASMSLPGRHTSKNCNFLVRKASAADFATRKELDGHKEALIITCMDGKEAILLDFQLSRDNNLWLDALNAKPDDRKPVCYNFQLKCDEKGRLYFIPSVTMVLENTYCNESFEDGCVSIDLNYDHVALTDIDKDGNRISGKVLRFNPENKTSGQISDEIGRIMSKVGQYCEDRKKPLVMEDIDTTISKHGMKYGNAKGNRHASIFAYRKMESCIENQSYRRSFGVIKINPAYTSQIGKILYMRRLGISIHEAASYVIGLKGMGLRDKLTLEEEMAARLTDSLKKELSDAGKDLIEVEEVELEPSLGNGGLGRLAACFIDSISSLGLTGDGVGLNYHFGLFQQVLKNNQQETIPNAWLTDQSWLVRSSRSYKVPFAHFTLTSTLYDIDVPGYKIDTKNRLRLFDLDSVDSSIIEDGINFDKTDIARNLTLFLYPDDSNRQGELLRIFQQYFMVSNGAQLIIDEAIEKGSNLHDLADYAVVQINDTHPSMVIPELIRLLTERGIGMDEAISIVRSMTAYTNHTILAEALEKWPLEFLQEVVPHLVPIIEELDRRVRAEYKDPAVQIIDENDRVHMAHMDIHYGYSVNGVAALHTEILKNSELKAFYDIYPEKFNNKTNGITFRRWLMHANPTLSHYLDDILGRDWHHDASKLEDLLSYEDKDAVKAKLENIKSHNKRKLARFLKDHQGVEINPNSIFDTQIKRLHEYKRQQMNALYVIHKYLDIKAGNIPARPITVLFGGKAAPAYTIAQDIIHLILCLSEVIANDPAVAPHLQVVMVENYNVTAASYLIPASDISEQISLASKEASGTGNMKFMLNVALTLGTMDGANVEIAELVGRDNIYIFGEDSETVIDLYAKSAYKSADFYEREAIKPLVDFIVSDAVLAVGDKERLTRLHNELINKDWFMTLLDLEDYIVTKERMLADYEDRDAWLDQVIVNIAKAGFFSSDRTIAQYNEDIWHLN